MDKKKKTEKKPAHPTEVALNVIRESEKTDIQTDPLGSWTGVPEDRWDRPIQDADDL